MAPAIVGGQPSVMVDFDEQLLQRLQAFQQANGLTATGKVDPSTWHTLIHTKPVLSDDGLWRWDGSAWHPTAVAPALTPPLGDGRTPKGLPQSKTVTDFGKDCAELKPAHKDAMREVAAELAAKPLGHDGYVLVVGTAPTADLAKRLAEAAGDYLRMLLTADERVDGRTLVEPKGKPTVEVTIRRREWQHKPAPKLEMPTKKVPTIDLSQLDNKPNVMKLSPEKLPQVVLSNAFIRVPIKKPVPQDILDDLSALANKKLGASEIADFAARIARLTRLSTAEQDELRRLVKKKLQEGSKEGIKKLLETIGEALTGAPAEEPLEKHGPSTIPKEPDGVFTIEVAW